ncbi:MAG: hypothetical protein QOJ01_728 [Solirubrobacterales bacterium]|jgi:RimJ/RimL family protein N-acetyltransferase|nr:hypothetical protein [Solirubrobacterales bacterium]
MPYPERVETERLLLRRWTAGDLGAMRAIWSDPAVLQSLHPSDSGDPDEIARNALKRHVGAWERDGFGLWAAVDPAEDEVIGWIGAWRQDVGPELGGEVEVGWTLRSPWWGRGLALEGARAAAATAFAEFDVERLISLIGADNQRSIAVATRLGSRPDGTTPHGRIPGLELSVYSLSRSTFGASPQSRSSL